MQHALYETWLNEALGVPLPPQRRSTCERCAMCHEGPGRSFRADVKCCMFYPRLPNFLVGGLLRTQGPQFLEKRRDDLRPWGLDRPPARSEALLAANTNGEFGQDPARLCPHFIQEGGGLCGIWTHREAVCATWFCKPDRARVGKALWNDLYRLLTAVEEVLARDNCKVMGLDPQGPFGAWEPEPFFLACEARVRDLSWAQIMALGGFELRFRLRDVRGSMRALSDTTLPEALLYAPSALHPLPGGAQRLEGYGPYDPIDVPAALLEALPAFDGRPLAAVLQELGAQAPDASTLQDLVDHGVLRPKV